MSRASLRVAFVCLTSLWIGGCLKSRKEPRLEVLDVTLETPSGRYRLESTEDPGCVQIDRPWLSLRVRVPAVESHSRRSP